VHKECPGVSDSSQPTPDPRLRRSLGISLVLIVVVWVGASIFSIVAHDDIIAIAGSLTTLATYASVHGVIAIIAIVLLLGYSRESLRHIGLRHTRLLSQVAIGIGFGAAIFVSNFVIDKPVEALVRHFGPNNAPAPIDLAPLFGNLYQYPIWLFLALFKGGFAEELWRIFGLTRFERVFGKPGLAVAIVLGSAAFGVAHLYQGVDSAVMSFIHSLMYVAIYLRARRALEPMVAHATYDIIGITLAYILF